MNCFPPRTGAPSGPRPSAALVLWTLTAGCGGDGGPAPSPRPERTVHPDTATLDTGGGPPGIAAVSIVARAATPLLGGWREGSTVFLAGGSTTTGIAATGRWADGAGCLDTAPGGALWWVDGVRGGPIVAVGDGGVVRWLRGAAPEPPGPPTTADLYGVEVRPDGGVHVVGSTRSGRGEAWRWTPDGGWEALVTDLDGALFKVQDGWLVGEGWWGTWDPTAPDATPQLHPLEWRGIIVQQDPAGCAWMGGRADGAPALFRDCGSGLEPLEGPGQGSNLVGLATTGGGDLWAATADGIPLSRSSDGSWSSPGYALARDLHGVVRNGEGRPLFLGGDFSGETSGLILGFAEGRAPVDLGPCPP